ncbi:WD-40 repeat-containing protein [Fomitopsis betulina]|nr:WD-40 repeat-containing protein [Fomitopsis betulina]
MPPPPSPAHILRTHAAPVRVLAFSDDNERLYSGDAEGTVAVTSTRTLRPLALWKAHTDGLLGIQEWERQIITDNKLHVWERVLEPAAALGHSLLETPPLCYSMDVNALNYCRFSLMSLPGNDALIALPNLVESSFADIWTLPSQTRLHAAVGSRGQTDALDGRGSAGIIMSLHLYEASHPHTSNPGGLRLLSAYENGAVTCWAHTQTDRTVSVEGMGWDSLWSVRLHVESVMAMTVSRDNSLALTVSADHLIGRYDIKAIEGDVKTVCRVHKTKHPGNGSIALDDDGRVCAVGGWDGRIRLYSTRSMKSLGTLEYHKQSCQAVTFARRRATTDETDDEMEEGEKAERGRWLAAGGQDQRVSLWTLMDFGSRPS